MNARAVALALVPLTLGHDEGWPAWTWACLGASVVAFAGFAAFISRFTSRA